MLRELHWPLWGVFRPTHPPSLGQSSVFSPLFCVLFSTHRQLLGNRRPEPRGGLFCCRPGWVAPGVLYCSTELLLRRGLSAGLASRICLRVDFAPRPLHFARRLLLGKGTRFRLFIFICVNVVYFMGVVAIKYDVFDATLLDLLDFYNDLMGLFACYVGLFLGLFRFDLCVVGVFTLSDFLWDVLYNIGLVLFILNGLVTGINGNFFNNVGRLINEITGVGYFTTLFILYNVFLNFLGYFVGVVLERVNI